MPEQPAIPVTSEAVAAQMNNMQAVIARMAANSASCKTWCITLVSAIMVLLVDKNKSAYSIIAVFPTLLFLLMDSYYLALERSFRGGYKQLLQKIQQQTFTINDLYQIRPDGKLGHHFRRSLLSPSIYIFYVGLLALIVIANGIACSSK